MAAIGGNNDIRQKSVILDWAAPRHGHSSAVFYDQPGMSHLKQAQ